MTKTKMMFDIISYLIYAGSITREEIKDRYDVSDKTVLRIIRFLTKEQKVVKLYYFGDKITMDIYE